MEGRENCARSTIESSQAPGRIPELGASLASFRCMRLRVELRAQSTVHLPAYQGSALRGAFGTALLRSCCILRNQRCGECLLKSRCIYSYVFETRQGDKGGGNGRYAAAPHPFVLNLESGNEQVLEKGRDFSFGITLVGRAMEFLPYFAYAFQHMGKLGLGKGRGSFDVMRLVALDGTDRETEVVYEKGALQMPRTILGLEQAQAACRGFAPNRLRLHLLTPMHLVYGGELCREPAFHVLVRHLLRRLGNLTSFHCDREAPPLDGGWIDLAEEATLVGHNLRRHKWERYSRRQDKRMQLGGILGELDYEGNLAPFLPLLVLGSWVNLGKHTTFGLGRFRMMGAEGEHRGNQ